jgi:hypothetical protein
MKEEDRKEFLQDFSKGDLSKKLDMWFYAMEQEALWEEIISEMSDIARMQGGGKEFEEMA